MSELNTKHPVVAKCIELAKAELPSSTGSATLRGKRVQIEGVGCGAIVDETEHTVGVLLDGGGCRVMYVRKQDLEESPGLWA